MVSDKKNSNDEEDMKPEEKLRDMKTKVLQKAEDIRKKAESCGRKVNRRNGRK